MTGNLDDPSLAERWMREIARVHGAGARDVLEGLLVRMAPDELAALQYEWPLWRRPKQKIPGGAWRVLLILAGRAWGKTRCETEWLQGEIRAGRVERFLLVGRTVDDCVKVLVRGKGSGLLAIAPPWLKPRLYAGQLPRLVYRDASGREIAEGYIAGASEPNTIRGDNLDAALWDEIAAVQPAKAAEVFYNVRFALRGRDRARFLLSTTSKKNRPLIKEIRDKSLKDPARWRIIQGHTVENRGNIPRDFLEDLIADYGGTALAAQELGGGVLDDEGTDLFDQDVIDAYRVRPPAPSGLRVAIGCDPGTSQNRGSDDTGIVVDGEIGGHMYTLEDLSGRHSPDAWALAIIDAFGRWNAESIVVERNAGGDLVRANLVNVVRIVQLAPEHAERRRRLGDSLHRIVQAIVEVHSKDGKKTRAEPLAGLYRQGRVHHVGELVRLEAQLVGFDESVSSMANKDRLDAHVHAAWHLLRLERDDVDHAAGFVGLEKANAFMATASRGPLFARSEGTAEALEDWDEENAARGAGGGGFGWGGRI